MKIGDEVGWRWVNGIATGVIKEMHPSRCEIISNGKKIVRNGTSDDPAVVISHGSGHDVVKLTHELQVVKKHI